jgi:predicted nuclease of predicted toxin-antitoxin system
MLLKLDKNLGRSHVELLRSAGHDEDRVHDEGVSGWADSAVWKRVCDDGRFFITLDLDIADIRGYKPGSHAGILLLRTHSRSSAAVLQILERVLKERRLESLAGCLAVADESFTRVRVHETAAKLNT